MADEALDDMLLEAAGRPKAAHGAEKEGSSARTTPKGCVPIQDYRSDGQSDSKSENVKTSVTAGLRHKKMPAKISQPRERDVGPPSSRMRSSVLEPRTAKDTALNELVARRMKSQDSDLQRKYRDASACARERERQVQTKISRKRRSSDSDSESDEDEDSSRGEDRSDTETSDDDDRTKEEPEAGVEDIKSITIRRSTLAKWFMEPFFEEVVAGCFARIGIGMSRSGQSIYRVCQVKKVDARDPGKQYTFENRHTYKFLDCVWGDEKSSARWQMVRASDSAPTEKEILEMRKEVDRCGGTQLSKASVDKKREALAKVNTFVYNAATVKQMLQEKKLATARPSNIALEKERIARELGVAESKGDHGTINRLQARLRELEQFSIQINKTNDARALALAEMNRRNRAENFKNASDVKPVNCTDAKAGEAGYDPFSRRWTRSQNYYTTGAPKVEKECEDKTDAPEVEKESEDKTEELKVERESEDKTEAPKVEKESEDKSTPVGANPAAPLSHQRLGTRVVPVAGATNLFSLHDFDLQISLAPVTQMGGMARHGAHAAYMARRQNLEASLGAQVERRDGQRPHTFTLTISDYERRRGLL